MAASRAYLIWAILLSLTWGAPVRCEPPIAEQRETERKQKQIRVDFYGDALPAGAIARLGTVRLRHTDGLEALAFAPDGKILASAGRESLRLWDAATGKQVLSIVPDEWTLCIAFSPDGKTIASGHWRGWTYLRDARTGQVIRRLGDEFQEQVSALAFSPDGKMLAAAAGDGVIRLWEVATGQNVREMRDGSIHPSPPAYALAFAPDGQVVFRAGSRNGDSAYSADGRFSAWVKDGKVSVWKGGEGAVSTKDAPAAYGVALAPDGAILACWESHDATHEVVLSGTISAKETIRLDPGGRVAAVAFAPDGKILATASGAVIRLWNAATGAELPQSHGEAATDRAVFSPDGKTLAIPNYGKIGLWDIAGQKQMLTLPCFPVLARPFVGFTPDGTAILTPKDSRTLCWWDLATGAQVRILADTNAAAPLALSPDGKVLAIGAGTEGVELWDVNSLQLRGTLRPPVHCDCTVLAFSPDGALLASGGLGNAVCVWDLEKRKPLAPVAVAQNLGPGAREQPKPRVPTVYLLGFLAGSKVLAIGHESAVTLCDVPSGRTLLVVPQDTGGLPLTAALSPDGKILATTGPWRPCPDRVWGQPGTRTLLLWETSSGKTIRRLIGHQGEVRGLAFAPSCLRLVSTSTDATAIVWDLASLDGMILGGASREPALTNLDRLWDLLAAEDAAAAYQALLTLVACGDRAADYLNQQLRPSEAVRPDQLRQLVANLDNEDFQVREKATKTLRDLGAQAEPALREALAGQPCAEVRHRLEDLLASLDRRPFPAERLRSTRAIQVLEYIGSSRARRLLALLTKGDGGAEQTQDANAALDRLNARRSR